MIEAGTSDSDAIAITLGRHRDGIKVHVKTWPDVEVFFSKWSGGVQERPAHGRLWKPVGDSELRLWALALHNVNPTPMRPYSLVHSGAGFVVGDGYANISFLRLIGISEPEGRSFVMETVLGKSEVASMAQRLSDACNLYYGEYLQDITMRAVVSVHRAA